MEKSIRFGKWTITFIRVFKADLFRHDCQFTINRNPIVFLFMINIYRYFLYVRYGYYKASQIKGRVKHWVA